MRVLIAIMSCARDVNNGDNQTIRDTWLTQPLPAGWDYKFFIGTNTQPKPMEEEMPTFQAHYERLQLRKPHTLQPVPQLNRQLLRGDEVELSVPDNYPYLVYKVRAMRQWADQQGYDYIFKCDTDTYVVLSRLAQSGFEQWNYTGATFPLTGSEDDFLKQTSKIPGHYAQGGPGYWLSRSAYQMTLAAPIYTLCEDVWTGVALHLHGIMPRADGRYEWGRIRFPKTAISVVNTQGPTRAWMFQIHAAFEHVRRAAAIQTMPSYQWVHRPPLTKIARQGRR